MPYLIFKAGRGARLFRSSIAIDAGGVIFSESFCALQACVSRMPLSQNRRIFLRATLYFSLNARLIWSVIGFVR